MSRFLLLAVLVSGCSEKPIGAPASGPYYDPRAASYGIYIDATPRLKWSDAESVLTIYDDSGSEALKVYGAGTKNVTVGEPWHPTCEIVCKGAAAISLPGPDVLLPASCVVEKLRCR